MEREDNQREPLIDLGAASVETKGPVGIYPDDDLGQPEFGLSND